MAAVGEQEKIPCGWCGAPVRPGVATCWDCLKNPKGPSAEREPVVEPAVVRVDLVVHLPGFVEIPLPVGGAVELGRDSEDDRIFDALEPYVDVHRHHVVLRNGQAGLVLRNLSTDAGDTWLDGVALPLGEETAHPVAPGQIIRLASRCTLKVEIA